MFLKANYKQNITGRKTVDVKLKFAVNIDLTNIKLQPTEGFEVIFVCCNF